MVASILPQTSQRYRLLPTPSLLRLYESSESLPLPPLLPSEMQRARIIASRKGIAWLPATYAIAFRELNSRRSACFLVVPPGVFRVAVLAKVVVADDLKVAGRVKVAQEP